MGEPLKSRYGREIPTKIASMISSVHKGFPVKAFVAHVMDGYLNLELMPRGRKIAQSLRHFLPDSYPEALSILVDSMGERIERNEGDALATFIYLPHSYFIADFGLEFFEDSMAAQYALTQRFTAEFCIRPFLEKYPEQTLAVLKKWTGDPSEHVRRLVSEGTRSRLPWSFHLKMFQRDPSPALALIEDLKDDVSLYVRRSVANHLNDVGKDNPDLLLKMAARWQKNACKDRQWIVKHALRSLVKAGHPQALAILGFGNAVKFKIEHAEVKPSQPKVGQKIRIQFELQNTGTSKTEMLVDLKIHFVKKNGLSAPKVFKIKKVSLVENESVLFSKVVSLENLTTRKHYPGEHRIEIMVNGVVQLLGVFTLMSV